MEHRNDPLSVDESAMDNARKWLARHGAPRREPSRLLAARLVARDLRSRTEVGLLVPLSGLIIAFALVREFLLPLEFRVDGHNLLGVVQLAAFYVLMAGVSWWTSRVQRRSEQRVAAALPRRVAHSALASPFEVLGGAHLTAVTFTYAGGIGLGVGLALGGGHVADRTIGLVFAIGTLAFGVITAVVAVEEVRRPALADDDESLAIDDVLRTEDAHRVLPFPAVIAAISAAEAISVPVSAALLGFAALTAVLWVFVFVRDHRRKLPVNDPAGAATS